MEKSKIYTINEHIKIIALIDTDKVSLDFICSNGRRKDLSDISLFHKVNAAVSLDDMDESIKVLSRMINADSQLQVDWSDLFDSIRGSRMIYTATGTSKANQSNHFDAALKDVVAKSTADGIDLFQCKSCLLNICQYPKLSDDDFKEELSALNEFFNCFSTHSVCRFMILPTSKYQDINYFSVDVLVCDI